MDTPTPMEIETWMEVENPLSFQATKMQRCQTETHILIIVIIDNHGIPEPSVLHNSIQL